MHYELVMTFFKSFFFIENLKKSETSWNFLIWVCTFSVINNFNGSPYRFFFSFLAYDVKQVVSDLHYFNNGLDECYFFSTLNLCVYIYIANVIIFGRLQQKLHFPFLNILFLSLLFSNEVSFWFINCNFE